MLIVEQQGKDTPPPPWKSFKSDKYASQDLCINCKINLKKNPKCPICYVRLKKIKIKASWIWLFTCLHARIQWVLPWSLHQPSKHWESVEQFLSNPGDKQTGGEGKKKKKIRDVFHPLWGDIGKRFTLCWQKGMFSVQWSPTQMSEIWSDCRL